jgi:hypothetical protein
LTVPRLEEAIRGAIFTTVTRLGLVGRREA